MLSAIVYWHKVCSLWPVSSDLPGGQSLLEVDSVINEQDLRYFLDGPAVQDMESAVLQEPTNVQLWISLAYKKLRGADEER